MKKKQKKRSSSAAPAMIVVAVVAMGLGSGAAMYGCRGNSNPTPTTTPTAGAVFPDPVPTGSPGAPPKVFVPAPDANGSHLTSKTVDLPNGTPEEVAAAALTKMAELQPPALPPGTKAKSVKFDKDGTATVDFNDALVKNFPGGDEAEALALNAIFGVLGQFPNVKQVQILVEGEKLKTLGGTQDLSEPQPVPQTVPGATGAGESGAAQGDQ